MSDMTKKTFPHIRISPVLTLGPDGPVAQDDEPESQDGDEPPPPVHTSKCKHEDGAKCRDELEETDDFDLFDEECPHCEAFYAVKVPRFKVGDVLLCFSFRDGYHCRDGFYVCVDRDSEFRSDGGSRMYGCKGEKSGHYEQCWSRELFKVPVIEVGDLFAMAGHQLGVVTQVRWDRSQVEVWHGPDDQYWVDVPACRTIETPSPEESDPASDCNHSGSDGSNCNEGKSDA